MKKLLFLNAFLISFNLVSQVKLDITVSEVFVNSACFESPLEENGINDGYGPGSSDNEIAVKINNENWTVYNSKIECSSDLPNIQYSKIISCPGSFPKTLPVCIKTYENDGQCDRVESCLTMYCQDIAIIPILNNSYNTNINIQFNTESESWGYATLKISLSGEYLNSEVDTTITSCKPFIWNGETLSKSREYQKTFTNKYGCDSIVNLTFNLEPIDKTIIEENGVLSSKNTGEYQWLNCNDNSSLLEDESNFSFTPKNTGSYSLKITRNNCIDTTDCFNYTATGIHNMIGENNQEIFPNPTTNGVIEITLSNNTKIDIINVYNMIGEKIIAQKPSQGKSTDINLGSKKGYYIIELIDSNGNKTFKKALNL